MIAHVDATDLRRALRTVTPAAASTRAIPALTGVLLEARGTALHLRATDLDAEIRTSIAAQVEADGVAVPPAKALYTLARELPDGRVTLRLDETRLCVTAPPAEYALLTWDAELFPDPPDLDAHAHSVQAEALLPLLGAVVYAAARDDYRGALSGVHMALTASDAIFSATDGHRAATARNLMPLAEGLDVEVILPRRMVQLALHTFRRAEGLMRLAVCEDRALLAHDGVEIVGRLCEGRFPDLSQVYDASSGTWRMTTDREALLRALRRVVVVTGDVPMIVLSPAPAIACDSSEGEARETLEGAQIEGEMPEIALDPRYLRDALGHIESDSVMLSGTDDMSPVGVRAALDAASHALHIIMPMRR